VDVRRMAMADQGSVDALPGIANAGSLAIGDGCRMDGIGVVMVEDKDVVIAAAGGDREFACLV